MNSSLPSPGGNPVRDNRRRINGRKLDRHVKSAFKITTPRGRRRKKYLTITESANYKALVIAVAADLAPRSK